MMLNHHTHLIFNKFVQMQITHFSDLQTEMSDILRTMRIHQFLDKIMKIGVVNLKEIINNFFS